MKRFLAIATLLGAISLAACSSNSNSSNTANSGTSSGEITVAGSTALLPLVKQAAQDYQAAHAGVKISVAGGGSRVGLTQAQAKGVTIGDSDIAPDSSQTDLVDHKVAVVIFAVAANSAAGIKNLTTKQVRDIFSGKVTNWNQVGGADQKITIVNRPQSSGTRAVFVSTLMGGAQPTANGLTQDSSGAVATILAQTPGAVSYVATSYLKNPSLVALSIDGNAANEANVSAKKYPFWAFEHMVTNGTPSKDVADFINYVSKDTALIKKLGFSPVTVTSTKGG